MVLGVAAIITAILNVVWSTKNQDAKWFRFISLSLTALTLCAFYSVDAKWVLNEDWYALMDVVPTMSKALWVLTIVSILINSTSLFKKSDR
jgi:hypothetical protein